MPSFTARLATDPASAERLANLLGEDDTFAANALDVAETAPGAWAVTVYFPDEPDGAALRRLGEVVRQALGPAAPSPVVAALPDIDWVAKSLADLKPVSVGRFFVHGHHDRAKVLPNALSIEIEASRAFGTGHHGTTAGCLAALGGLARRRSFANVLDLGTGTGVLAIAAARLWRCPVLASDIDPVSTRLASENARLNGAARQVRAITAAGFRHPLIASRAPFDLIVANILAGPLVALATDLVRHLAPGGSLVLSGLLPPQGRLVEASYTRRGLHFVRRDIRDGWLTLAFGLPKPRSLD